MKTLLLNAVRNKIVDNEVLLYNNVIYSSWLYEKTIDAPNVGYFLSLKADLYQFNTIDNDIKINENIVKDYDVVISYTPCLKTPPRKDQLFCYFEPEPPSIAYLIKRPKWNIQNQIAEPPYDFFLNNYTEKSNHPSNIPCSYCYDIEYFNRVQKLSNNGKKIIFIQKRTLLTKQFLSSLRQQYDISGEGRFVERTYDKYLFHFKQCDYCISIDPSEAAGQVIAEACLLGVIPFSSPHKLFTRILAPKFCWVENEKEVSEKIKLINENPNLKKTILQELEYNKQKLSLSNFQNQIIDLYNKKRIS